MHKIGGQLASFHQIFKIQRENVYSHVAWGPQKSLGHFNNISPSTAILSHLRLESRGGTKQTHIMDLLKDFRELKGTHIKVSCEEIRSFYFKLVSCPTILWFYIFWKNCPPDWQLKILMRGDKSHLATKRCLRPKNFKSILPIFLYSWPKLVSFFLFY